MEVSLDKSITINVSEATDKSQKKKPRKKKVSKLENESVNLHGPYGAPNCRVDILNPKYKV